MDKKKVSFESVGVLYIAMYGHIVTSREIKQRAGDVFVEVALVLVLGSQEVKEAGEPLTTA